MSKPELKAAENPEHAPVESLLRQFFKSELPHPWPAWQAPARAVVTPVPQAQPAPRLFTSHFALAASVAMMAFGLWVVSDHLGQYHPSQIPGAKVGFRDPDTRKEELKNKAEKAQHDRATDPTNSHQR